MKKELIYVGYENDNFLIEGINPFYGDDDETKVRFVRSIIVSYPAHPRFHLADMYEIKSSGTRFALVEFAYGYYGVYKIIRHKCKMSKKEK